MGFKCGIVGLPNIGKSTLFNAITKTQSAEAADYPFCTIEPNIGKISVPDERLEKLAKIANSKKIIYNQINIVDIAGLVANAHRGEGLGNKFLGNVREVDAILHMVNCFNSKTPVEDIEIIEMELLMSDLQMIEKKINSVKKNKAEVEELKYLYEHLNSGKHPNELDKNIQIDHLNLITAKPYIYICNLPEEDTEESKKLVQTVRDYSKAKNTKIITISAKIEEEISMLEEEEQQEMLNDLGIEESGLNKISRAGYELLDLLTFFTIGEKEARAWSVLNNATAPQAAGVIHTDFERGFIKAETISYKDYIEYNGESGCRENGKLLINGKDYIVQDGDVLHFKFNV
ncbi:MAG: redox-regulated ATPase YchF [Anaplasmataceae bacterium]|nr:redox-regulated ATPase YchF [Anaplasmataceae bacterium]